MTTSTPSLTPGFTMRRSIPLLLALSFALLPTVGCEDALDESTDYATETVEQEARFGQVPQDFRLPPPAIFNRPVRFTGVLQVETDFGLPQSGCTNGNEEYTGGGGQSTTTTTTQQRIAEPMDEVMEPRPATFADLHRVPVSTDDNGETLRTRSVESSNHLPSPEQVEPILEQARLEGWTFEELRLALIDDCGVPEGIMGPMAVALPREESE